MQIVCPNCGARYEVPPSALAAPGRHVQCATCQHAWFHLIELGETTEGLQSSVGPTRYATAQATADATPPEQVTPAPATDASPGIAPTVDNAPEAEGAGPVDAPPRREIDPEVLRILREEAAFETARRQGQRPAPPRETETQTPRPAPARPAGEDLSPATPTRPEKRPSETTPGDAVLRRAAGRPGARAQPDVAGVAAGHREAPDWSPRNLPVALSAADRDIAVLKTRRRGFRAGFALTAGACCLALGLYLAAPALSDLAPGLEPATEAVLSWGERAQTEIANALRRAADRIPGG